MLLADKSGAGWLGKMWFISCRALNSSVIEILQFFSENISIWQCFLFIKEIFSYFKNLSKLNFKKNAQAAWPAKFCPVLCLGQTSSYSWHSASASIVLELKNFEHKNHSCFLAKFGIIDSILIESAFSGKTELSTNFVALCFQILRLKILVGMIRDENFWAKTDENILVGITEQ